MPNRTSHKMKQTVTKERPANLLIKIIPTEQGMKK